MLAGESPGSFSVGRTVDLMCTGETQHAASLLPGCLNFICCLDVHEDLGRNARQRDTSLMFQKILQPTAALRMTEPAG